MDSFYQNFAEDSSFFTLPDFIFHAGATVADYYRQEFMQKYGEIRQEKSDEVVTFSADILIGQDIEVTKNVGKLVAPIMSFAYDRQNSGIQEIILNKPESNCVQFERSNLAQIWQIAYTGPTDRIFWVLDRGAIRFFNKTRFNVQYVTVLYVPGVGPDMLVADSLIDWVVNNTVQKMKSMKEGVVVKKSIDGNENFVMETELNKRSLK